MDVMDAARTLAHDQPGGATALAVRMGCNGTTLNHELRETGGAKLGLRRAVLMTVLTGDLRILNAFAAEAGCMVLQLPEALQVDGNECMQDLGRTAKEFADVVQEVSASCADGDITANELQRVERQWAELVTAGQRLLAGLRARHEEGKPQHLKAVGRS